MIKPPKYQESIESEVTKTTIVIVPGFSTRILEQYEESCNIKVPIVDKIEYDISFVVEDWKTYAHGSPLWHNKRKHSLRGSKTHTMLVIESMDDLKDLLIGVNSDYPKQRKDLLETNSNIREAWDKLVDPSFRTVEINGFQYFEEASTGQTRTTEGDHAFYVAQNSKAPKGDGDEHEL